jgi:hypothetical protein
MSLYGTEEIQQNTRHLQNQWLLFCLQNAYATNAIIHCQLIALVDTTIIIGGIKLATNVCQQKENESSCTRIVCLMEQSFVANVINGLTKAIFISVAVILEKPLVKPVEAIKQNSDGHQVYRDTFLVKCLTNTAKTRLAQNAKLNNPLMLTICAFCDETG